MPLKVAQATYYCGGQDIPSKLLGNNVTSDDFDTLVINEKLDKQLRNPDDLDVFHRNDVLKDKTIYKSGIKTERFKTR